MTARHLVLFLLVVSGGCGRPYEVFVSFAEGSDALFYDANRDELLWHHDGEVTMLPPFERRGSVDVVSADGAGVVLAHVGANVLRLDGERWQALLDDRSIVRGAAACGDGSMAVVVDGRLTLLETEERIELGGEETPEHDRASYQLGCDTRSIYVRGLGSWVLWDRESRSRLGEVEVPGRARVRRDADGQTAFVHFGSRRDPGERDAIDVYARAGDTLSPARAARVPGDYAWDEEPPVGEVGEFDRIGQVALGAAGELFALVEHVSVACDFREVSSCSGGSSSGSGSWGAGFRSSSCRTEWRCYRDETVMRQDVRHLAGEVWSSVVTDGPLLEPVRGRPESLPVWAVPSPGVLNIYEDPQLPPRVLDAP